MPELDIDNTKCAKVMTIRFRDSNNREGVETVQRMHDKGWRTMEPVSLGRDGYFETVLYWPTFLARCSICNGSGWVEVTQGQIHACDCRRKNPANAKRSEPDQ